MAYITDDKVKKITDLSTASSLIGDEKIPSQKGNNAYGLSLSRVGGFAVRGTCSTAAGTQDKVVTLTGYTGTEIPSLISVTFTKANTFGDCTASPATYPRLIVQNSAGVTIATLNVCDARGHTAGTGCWNAGDKMRFNIELNSSNTGDALIDNSDIRQQTSTMTIKADGYKEYSVKTINFTGTTNSAGNVTLPATIGTSTIIGFYLNYSDVSLYSKLVRNGGQNYWSLQVTNNAGSPITDKAISGTIVYIDL